MDTEKCRTFYDLATGDINGECSNHSKKRLGDILGIFADKDAAKDMNLDTIAYEVASHTAVSEGTSGGLFFGTSRIHPGKVGNEFFMTKGHFHSRRETAEYYWGIEGNGILLLMDEDGVCKAEEVERGSLHYIGGNIAHRLVNCGKTDLVVGACWPSDAGHDYGSIETVGFPVRVVEVNGEVVLIEEKR